MELTVTIFQRKRGPDLEWHTIGLGRFNRSERGRSPIKVRQKLLDSLRKATEKIPPGAYAELEPVRGRKLEVLKLDLNLDLPQGGRRRVFGDFPVVVEPRPAGPAVADPLWSCYHPLRPDEWFVHEPDRQLVDEASAYFRACWNGFDDTSIGELKLHERDRLTIVALTLRPKSLLAELEAAEQQPPPAMIGAPTREGGEALLRTLGTNETLKVVGGSLDAGMPRSPYREQLQQLLCGQRKASVLLVGPSGSGKSTLVRQLVHDLLEADDYPTHRNLDEVHRVWSVRGRRIIAGMSYLGQWEQRCVDLFRTAREHKAVLWVDDIAAWGRIGQSRESERSLATFFRGPVSRGELIVIGETTPEGYQRLQDDAPGLAAAFATLFVEPTDLATTMRLLVHEARKIELQNHVAFDPRAFRTIYDLGGALGAGGVHPGKSLDLLRSLGSGDRGVSLNLSDVEAEANAGRKINAIKRYREIVASSLLEAKNAVEHYLDHGQWPTLTVERPDPPPVVSLLDDQGPVLPKASIGSSEVIRLLAGRTGMPPVLLSFEHRLDPERLHEAFAGQIIGQPEAVAAMRDLVLRIKARLVDATRPYGVFLFTGPTGTGKTEMAKCVAEYLYGSAARLVRFDMSEYRGFDAPSRLIGDRFRPEGALTSRIRTQPFSVVLLDEIEKADPSVLNLMLQLFDDGRLTDASGRVVDFTHTVVIMTSNLGAKSVPSVGFDDRPSDVIASIESAVRDFFPPELFNRIDKIVRFEPLGSEAARRIARRELSRLVERRGLTERGVFVQFTPSVIELVVRDGFRSADGARSLKRWLEEHVGAFLGDEIAASSGAAVRVYWLYRHGEGLALHREWLREIDPPSSPSRFEPILGWTGERLRQHVPALLERIAELRRSPELEALVASLRRGLSRFEAGEAQAAEPVYNLERLRSEVDEIEENLRIQAEYDPRLIALDPDLRLQDEGELIATDRFSSVEVGRFDSASTRVTTLDFQELAPRLPLRNRGGFLDAVASLHFLERAVGRADDPGEHAVIVELLRLSRGRGINRFAAAGAGLLEWLAQGYAKARAEVDAFACETIDGAVLGAPHQSLDTVLGVARHRVVLRLVGPAVRVLLAAEHGTHVRESLSGGTELVRVRVSPVVDPEGLEIDPLGHLRRLQSQRRIFAEALEAGHGELPPNPDEILPIVRRYHFDPEGGGGLESLVVEDYRLAHVLRMNVRRLGDALASLWLLHLGLDRPEDA